VWHHLGGRARYELIKRLTDLGALGVDLNTEFKSKGTHAKVAHGVTREVALRTGEALAAARVEFELIPLAASQATPSVRTAKGGNRLVIVLVLLAVVASGLGSLWIKLGSSAGLGDRLHALTPTAATSPTEAVHSVVSVRCPRSVGSGFYVAENLVVTNNHVVCAPGEPMTVVRSSGKETTGEVVSRDPKRDLAFVRVKAAGHRCSWQTPRRPSSGRRSW
jgi:serine protease Do